MFEFYGSKVNSKSTWHIPVVAQLSGYFEQDIEVRAVILAGSLAGDAVQVDEWSDVDVKVILSDQAVERYYAATDWLEPVGHIVGLERHVSPFAKTLRVCLEGFRRFDFVFIAESMLRRESHLLQQPCAVLWSRLPDLEMFITIREKDNPMFTTKALQYGTIILLFCLLTGCRTTATPAASTVVPTTSTEAVGLANPASVFCEAQGGRVDIRDESGGEVGYCALPDGGECEEWAFFRGECSVNIAICPELAGEMEQRLGVPVGVTDSAPFQDPISGQNFEGCQAAASGTGLDFEMDVAYDAVREIFEARGWQADINYDAAGPTGMLGGYRQDSALCLWLVEWTPAEDANCPDDQPISACELAPEQKLYTVAVNCLQP